MLKSFGKFLSIACLCTFGSVSNNVASDARLLSKENELGYGAHALTDTNMSGFSIGLGGGLSHTMVKYRATSDNPYSTYLPGEAELEY